MIGVSLGDAAALRRVLGGRRGGRYGVLLSGGLALLAAPGPIQLAVGIAVYLALALVAAVIYREPEGLGAPQCLRLMLWALPVPLVLAAAARLLGAGSALPLLLAVIAAYLLLDGGLRAGLEPGPAPYSAGSPEGDEAGSATGAAGGITSTGVTGESPGRR